jgi:hypothetical protein
MRLAELHQEVAHLMALYVEEARLLSAMSLTDISAASDMFLVELFRELFDLPGLRNVNSEKSNYPGIDLGDDSTGRAFQITADASLDKVLSTLETSIRAEVHKKYPQIQVYVVTGKQRSYKQASIDKTIGEALKFNAKKDILDSYDVVKAFKLLELDKAERVAAIVRKHVKPKAEVSSDDDTEALERDVENRFQEAIDRSPFPEIHDQDQLSILGQQMLEKSSARLPKKIRRTILIRASRAAALRKRVDEAERFFDEAGKLTEPSGSDRPARALILEARGDSDAALKLLRDRIDADSVSTMLGVVARVRGDEQALAWVASEAVRIADLTTHGVMALSLAYLRLNRIDELRILLDQLKPDQTNASPYLLFLRGAIRLVSIFARSAQTAGLGGIFLDLDFARPVLDDAELITRLDGAIDDLRRSVERIRNLNLPRSLIIAEWYVTWACLIHPNRKTEARKQLEADLKVPAIAVQRLQLAFRYLEDFDSAPLDQYLKRRESTGGLDDDDLVAALILRTHRGEHPAVAALLSKYTSQYADRLGAQMVAGMQIQALAYANDATSARAALEEARAALDPTVIATLEAEIAKAAGADPVAEYVRLYEQLKSEVTLRALVAELIQHGNHRLLGPYAEKLYAKSRDPRDMVIAAKAYLAVEDYANFLRVVESHPITVERSLEVKQRYAWRLLHSGRLKEARDIANSLRADAETRDIPLEINLAIETGQWDFLAEPLGVYLANKNQIDALTLIQAAQLALATGYGPYRALMNAAVDKPDVGADVLLGAYTIAVEGGLEDKDSVAYDWFRRSMEASGPDGPVQRFELKELLDRQIEWNQHSRKVNDLIISGDVPLIVAAPSLRTTVVDAILGNFIRNLEERDARRRTIVPLFSGRRSPTRLQEAKRVALDITAVLALGYLGLLPKVIQCFDEVIIPAGLMRELLDGQKKARQFQKSQLARAKEVQRLLSAKLKVVRPTAGATSDLNELVGVDLATLIQAARADGGVVVRPAPVFKLKSAGKELADLSRYSDCLCDMHSLLIAMRDLGLVSSESETVADKYFQLQDQGWASSAAPDKSRPIYLDDVAISYLQTTNLLGAVVNGFDSVFILSSTEEESESWLTVDRRSQEASDVIQSIRDAIAGGYSAGRVQFGPHRPKSDLDDDIAMSTFNLLGASLGADVAVLDDRAFNKESFITDNAQRNVPIATSLDVIEELSARNAITKDERVALRHRLRVAGAGLIPVESDEILAAAQRGGNTESLEFREISNSIRLARVRQMPRFPAEMPWFLSVASGFREAIKQCWRTEKDKSRATLVADLLLTELPRGADWLPLWQGAAPLNWAEAVNRTMAASLSLAVDFADRESRSAYFEWLEDRVLRAIRSLDPDAYQRLIEQLKSLIVNAAGADGE